MLAVGMAGCPWTLRGSSGVVASHGVSRGCGNRWRVQVSAHGGEGTRVTEWRGKMGAACVSAALSVGFVGSGCVIAPQPARADDPFTLFGIVVKKNLVEELDDGGTKVVARKSGFSVNACVAGLTLADSNRFKSFADDNDAVAASLIRVAGAIGSSRWSGPAHWRVAAELRARAAELGGDASAASLLTSLAASLPSTPPRRADPGDEKNPSANPSGADDVHLSGPCPRAVAASTAAATFRRAGALASTSATKPLVRSLLEASAQIDVGSDATHLWPLHALGEFIFYFRMGNLSDIVFCSQASWRITSGHRSPGTRPRCVAWRSR